MEISNSTIYLLRTAQSVAKYSNCVSKKVGCVILSNSGKFIYGFNNTVKGAIRCNEYFSNISLNNSLTHSEFNNRYEVHAEMNAILFALKNNINIDGATCYITHQPCWNCTKHLAAAGVKKIIYINRWDKMNEEETLNQIKYLNSIGVEITQVNPTDRLNCIS